MNCDNNVHDWVELLGTEGKICWNCKKVVNRNARDKEFEEKEILFVDYVDVSQLSDVFREKRNLPNRGIVSLSWKLENNQGNTEVKKNDT